MTKLTNTLQNWQTDRFEQTLKHELKSLKPGTLPLHLATTQGGIADDSDISVTLLEKRDEEEILFIRTAIFFNEVIGGCNCGDDPLTDNAYCEMEILIDKSSAETSFNVTASGHP